MALAVTLLRVACQPMYPPPEGYEAECYGGNFDKYLEKSRPARTFSLIVTERDWPAVQEAAEAVAAKFRLRYFDTSVHTPFVHALGVALCSERGLWIDIGQRIWQGDPSVGPIGRYAEISIRRYKADFGPWEPIADAMEQRLSERWKVERLP